LTSSSLSCIGRTIVLEQTLWHRRAAAAATVIVGIAGLAGIAGCGATDEGSGDVAVAADLAIADGEASDLSTVVDLSAVDVAVDLATSDLMTPSDLSAWKCVAADDCPVLNTCCSDGTSYSACIAGAGMSPCNNFSYGTPTCTGGGQCGSLGSSSSFCCPTTNPTVHRCRDWLVGSGSGCFTDVTCTAGSCPSNQTCTNGYCRFN
jgi:hypothetical protein